MRKVRGEPCARVTARRAAGARQLLRAARQDRQRMGRVSRGSQRGGQGSWRPQRNTSDGRICLSKGCELDRRSQPGTCTQRPLQQASWAHSHWAESCRRHSSPRRSISLRAMTVPHADPSWQMPHSVSCEQEGASAGTYAVRQMDPPWQPQHAMTIRRRAIIPHPCGGSCRRWPSPHRRRRPRRRPRRAHLRRCRR